VGFQSELCDKEGRGKRVGINLSFFNWLHKPLKIIWRGLGLGKKARGPSGKKEGDIGNHLKKRKAKMGAVTWIHLCRSSPLEESLMGGTKGKGERKRNPRTNYQIKNQERRKGNIGTRR